MDDGHLFLYPFTVPALLIRSHFIHFTQFNRKPACQGRWALTNCNTRTVCPLREESLSCRKEEGGAADVGEVHVKLPGLLLVAVNVRSVSGRDDRGDDHGR